jgi:ParB family transcriptional regulator, chromosome partitioning protein
MDRNVLGKGLGALIPEGTQVKERIQTLSIDSIKASTFQPRKTFSDEKLKELAESIKTKGMIQPILVRQTQEGYELIAGERRFRAARLLNYKEVPVIVKQVKDEDLLELSLVENIQREELTRIEEAKAYERLASEFGLTHEKISERVSKDRTTITNLLRLLELPEKIQRFLDENTITMGHAKSLLSLGDEKSQLKLCQRIIKRGLSVRQSEILAKNATLKAKPYKRKNQIDINLASIEESLQHRFGTRVRITQGKKRGKIVIDFYSSEDLERVLSLLSAK